MSRIKRKFYLDKENAKISGVCAGIADYFGWDATLVRIAWVIATIFGSPVMLAAYILAAWLVDAKPAGLDRYGDVRAGVDETRYGYARAECDRPTAWRFSDVRGRFDRVENRLRTLEQVVTSREFQMDRELRGAGRV